METTVTLNTMSLCLCQGNLDATPSLAHIRCTLPSTHKTLTLHKCLVPPPHRKVQPTHIRLPARFPHKIQLRDQPTASTHMATCRPIPTPALPWLQPQDIAPFTTLPTRPSYPVAAAAMLWVQPMEIAPLPTRQSAIPPRQPRETVIPSTPDQLYSHMATPWLVAPPTVGLARRPETCVPAKDPIQRTFQTRICQHPRATTHSLTTPTLRSRTARARMGRYHIHGDHWVNSSLLRARTARIRMDRCRIKGEHWVNSSLIRTCTARVCMDRCRIRGARWVNSSLPRTCTARTRMGRCRI